MKLLLDIKWLRDLAASKGFARAQLPIQYLHNRASSSSFPIVSSTNEIPWQGQRQKYTPRFTIHFNNVNFF